MVSFNLFIFYLLNYRLFGILGITILVEIVSKAYQDELQWQSIFWLAETIYFDRFTATHSAPVHVEVMQYGPRTFKPINLKNPISHSDFNPFFY